MVYLAILGCRCLSAEVLATAVVRTPNDLDRARAQETRCAITHPTQIVMTCPLTYDLVNRKNTMMYLPTKRIHVLLRRHPGLSRVHQVRGLLSQPRFCAYAHKDVFRKDGGARK